MEIDQLPKQNRCSTSHSRFFLVYSASNDVNLCNPDKSHWQKMDSGQSWLFCADNLKSRSELSDKSWWVSIGQRHENGDGIFIRIFRENEIISFETDEMTGVPVFWMRTDDWTIIASDLNLIINLGKSLGPKLKIDPISASEFLTTGYVFAGEKTLIKGTNILPPKTILKLDILKGDITLKKCGEEVRYFKKRLDKKYAPLKFREVLENGFKRLFDKRIALLLSGGGSSRILASCAVAAGLDVDFYTFGQSTVNDSDFSIANKVVYRLGKKTNCFSTSGENFLANWKKMPAYSNWTNDSVWWAGRIPSDFFEKLKRYDVVIRGDGDGCYGFGGRLVSVSDILHRFEITPNSVAWRFAKYFANPQIALRPAMESRNRLVRKYESYRGSFLELKNILYREIREWRGAVPGAWYFSRIVSIDAPFLWKECLKIAFSLPEDKLVVRWIIFEALKLDTKINEIPFSSGPSWNNRLEFYYSGVWEELLDYVKQWSPWPLNMEALRSEFLKPPNISEPPSITGKILDASKKFLQSRKYVRSIGLRYFPNLVSTSMSDRILIRIALVSSLCEELASSEHPVIIQTSKRKA